MNRPKKVILHCAASPDTDNKVHYGMEGLRDTHVRENGWNDIGYHWYITRDGELHKCREENVKGAHVKSHNKDTLGVCYEGSHLPTVAQVSTLCDLYRQIKSVHGIEWVDWEPHYRYSKKDCPGFAIESIQSIFRKLS